MALGALLAITLVSIAWSLWIRRLTWHCRWEVAATLNIALQGAAVLLMSPLASATVGHWLHALTGEWNLEDWIGHDCYIVAASSIAYNVVGRLEDGTEFRWKFKHHIEYPATLCIPLLLAAFTLGAGPRTYRPDFFRAPTDNWLTLYWAILCGTLAYILAYGARALMILRDDPRSRTIANIYLLSSISGVGACASRTASSFLPADLQDTRVASIIVWALACGCGAGFALAAAHSWRAKMRWFTVPKFTIPDVMVDESARTPKYSPRVDRPAF